MKTLVAYYSMTGNTKKIALELSEEISAEIEEIKEAKKRKKGILNFISSGFMAIKGKESKILKLEKNLKDYNVIVMGSPVWASSLAPSVVSFLKNHNLENKKIYLFLTAAGERNPKAIEQLKELAPKNKLISYCVFFEKEIKSAGYKEKLKEFAGKII